MFEITAQCGRCSNLVDFVLEAVRDYTVRTPEQVKSLGRTDTDMRPRITMRTLYDEDPVNGAALVHCPRCHGPSLITFKTTRKALEGIKETFNKEGSLFGGQSLISISEIFPRPPEPEIDPNWPVSIHRQFKDAQSMLSQGITPSIVIGVCRTVLDLATKELHATDGSLFNRIKTLQEQGQITAAIADWAHRIRLDGNQAVHEGVGEEEEAKEFIEFLRMFLSVAFSLPKTIAAKQSH